MYKTLLFITLLLLQVSTAYSEVYKWIDENGKVIYGDKPTTNDADKIKIKNPPKQDKYYQERYERQQKLLNVIQEERDEKITSQNEEKEKKEKQEKECSDMKKKLKKMKDSTHLFEETDDPNNPKIYTDKERKAEEDKREKYIKENC